MSSSLTHWEPFSEITEIRTRLDQMFNDLNPRGEHRYTPAIDVMRRNGDIVVRADLPGMKADDVKIEVEDNVLTIRGEHEEKHEEKEGRYMRRERRWGSFERSMALPNGVDPGRIEAKTHDGVLEVKVPVPEESGRKTVTITPTDD